MDAFNFPIPSIEVAAVLPMAIVALTGVLALVTEILKKKKTNDRVITVTLVGLIVAAISLGLQLAEPRIDTLNDMVIRDRFSVCTQLFIVISAAIAVLFSDGYLREKRISFGEFYPLITWASVGAMMMTATTNLLIVFLGVEVLSVALYVLAGLSRREEKSEESAMKYFLLGAFASGFLLYGIAMVYGATGSLNLESIAGVWVRHDPTQQGLILMGVALLLIGLGFKSSLVPFHQWTPDVYQGAPTNVTAFMATGAKVGAFAALYRFLDSVTALGSIVLPLLCTVAVLTIVVGNVAALKQQDIKRILGYSSISHAGYVLVAMIVNFKSLANGMDTVLWYLISYVVMSMGAFAVVSFIASSGKESTKLADLNGLAKRSPFLAWSLLIFMLSLAGFPPTAGFWGKAFILRDAYVHGYLWLAVVIALNSIVSVFYYYKIAAAAFVSTDQERFPKMSKGLVGACTICVAAILGGFVFFQPIISFLGSR